MLPSTPNSRRTARPLKLATVDIVHNRSHSSARPSTSVPSPRGRRSLGTQLRYFLCGCGLLYVVLLWYSSSWTTRATSGQAVVASMRATTMRTTTSEEALLSQARVAVNIHAPSTPAPAVLAHSAATTWTPTPLTQGTTSNRLPSTSPSNVVDIAWLRSLVLTAPEEPESATVAPTVVPLSLEDHTARMQELEDSRQSLTMSVDMLKNQLAKVHEELQRHAAIIADEEDKQVRPLPRGRGREPSSSTRPRTFKCIGWRATRGCGPRGPRDPSHDRTCTQRVSANTAGYCEIEDVHTQERFRVMETSCDTLRSVAHMSCADAPRFANFSVRANELLYQQNQQNQQPSIPNQKSRGIVMVVYPKMLPSAYATLRTLRRLACTLHVELWYSPRELQDAATHPIVYAMVSQYGPVTLRAIEDANVRGFTTKIHAIRHSAFDHVLFLDADNVPVKDPAYLFTLPQYEATGALFWPDFWHPDHTIFAVHNRSLVWEYLDLPFIDMFEQESGQLVVDKTRSQKALAMLELLAFHQPNLLENFKIVHGDKDLFRLAWLKSNSSFHMVTHPPAVAGNVLGDMFCGQTMAQLDPNGELLFLHRNAQKLRGRHAKTAAPGYMDAVRVARTPTETEVDPEIWTHLQQFKPTATRAEYTIEIYKGSARFPANQWCYGKPSLATPHFDTVPFADLPARAIESEIIAYAVEATDLVREAARVKR